MAQTGQAVPLAYGYNWVTGAKLQSRTLVDTGDIHRDSTRIGFWLLGEGEWDGLVEMWDTALGRLLYLSENDDPTTLHFHPGCDAVIGSGSTPSSQGGDQGVDSFWSDLPPGLQPLHYHRWAYYAIRLKQLVNYPPNTNQDDASVWADVNPIGLWRALRCRVFDATGAMTAYAFTRNPAMHYVDMLCRRKLFPEYTIDQSLGAQDLPNAVRARFDWAAISDTAAYFDALRDDGFPRFTGDYAFAAKTTLQACLTQILTCSRSFSRERSGKFSIIADRPRASVFTFGRANATSFTPTDADLHTAANNYVAAYRDLQVPAAATIASIDFPNYQKPVVTTQQSHPFAQDDYIVIGGTGTTYDSYWQVDSVPAGDSVTTLTLKTKGSNYPSSLGPGGRIGLRFSRFKQRYPEFRHKQHQLARGATGVGIPRQRNRVPVETDFGNCTWQQVARVSAYQRALALGPDVEPYLGVPKITLRAPLFVDDRAGTGRKAIQLEPGDVITIDDTLSTAYAGMFEVAAVPRLSLAGSSPSSGMQRAPAAGGVELTLRPYSDGNYPESTAVDEPGWPDVPSLPGVQIAGTIFPLADGEAAFFTGAGSHGQTFQMLPGFPTANLRCWASPQGYVESDGQVHFIQDCDASSARKLSLIYNDSGHTWNGDLNWAGLTWRSTSSAVSVSAGGIDFTELTLKGGEKIALGKGILASGTSVALPSGYDLSRAIALAFPKSASNSGHPSHGLCAYITAPGVVHHAYEDGEQNHWEGPAQVFVFAIKNNLGTWRKTVNGWFYCPLPGARTLAVGGFSILDPGCSGTRPTIYGSPGLYEVLTGGAIPALTAMPPTTLQTMTGPNGFQIVDHPAHGVKACLVNGALQAPCTFSDGENATWYGSSGVFSLLYDTPSTPLGGSPLT